jgi:hypothetical protein
MLLQSEITALHRSVLVSHAFTDTSLRRVLRKGGGMEKQNLPSKRSKSAWVPLSPKLIESNACFIMKAARIPHEFGFLLSFLQ